MSPDATRVGTPRLLRAVRQSYTNAIIAACAVVFVVTTALDLFGVVPARVIFTTFGASWYGVAVRGRIFQPVTCALLHGGIVHLFFNMMALSILGPGVELALGRRRYLRFSLYCALAGSAGYLLWNWGGTVPAVGYSGVVFGILAAQAVYFPNQKLLIWGIVPVKKKHAIVLLGALEIALQFAGRGDSVAHSAHIGGAAFAWLYLKAPMWRMRWRAGAYKTSWLRHFVEFKR